ncbi:hypothetical protein B0H12DRAFT_1129948 [Mycena haematopus]|nr:hypothetical protein B0H12DRAFT_1129948 [Mycena haematopus]
MARCGVGDRAAGSAVVEGTTSSGALTQVSWHGAVSLSMCVHGLRIYRCCVVTCRVPSWTSGARGLRVKVVRLARGSQMRMPVQMVLQILLSHLPQDQNYRNVLTLVVEGGVPDCAVRPNAYVQGNGTSARGAASALGRLVGSPRAVLYTAEETHRRAFAQVCWVLAARRRLAYGGARGLSHAPAAALTKLWMLHVAQS